MTLRRLDSRPFDDSVGLECFVCSALNPGHQLVCRTCGTHRVAAEREVLRRAAARTGQAAIVSSAD